MVINQLQKNRISVYMVSNVITCFATLYYTTLHYSTTLHIHDYINHIKSHHITTSIKSLHYTTLHYSTVHYTCMTTSITSHHYITHDYINQVTGDNLLTHSLSSVHKQRVWERQKERERKRQIVKRERKKDKENVCVTFVCWHTFKHHTYTLHQVTGDNLLTANSVGRSLGIEPSNIIAQVSQSYT